jgi:hypothetical protein
MSEFEEMRVRAKTMVKQLWPQTTHVPPDEVLNIVADIATAVAWHEVKRASYQEKKDE